MASGAAACLWHHTISAALVCYVKCFCLKLGAVWYKQERGTMTEKGKREEREEREEKQKREERKEREEKQK